MNPILGVLFHWLGGLASGSFYVPYRAVRKWSWETYWLVGGVFSWIICPWLLASILTTNVTGALASQPISTLGWTYFFGMLWGFGGLTFGLAMRSRPRAEPPRRSMPIWQRQLIGRILAMPGGALRT